MVDNTNKHTLLSAVLRRPFYALLSAVVAAGLALLYYYLTISVVPVSSALEMVGPLYVTAAIALTFTTAALAGINTSLAIFKIKNARLIAIKRSGSSTAFGSTLMAFAPGCSACTTPLVAVFGTAGGLALFPLQGLEFKMISVAVLTLSTYWMAKSPPHQNVCGMGDKVTGD
jgi:hypothetical protein